ncbi:N-acetylmuramoyl-L-alanine amidase [Clostridium estertheticum]|nr:N-acetylmuramoyl-L-alanine amidase [Clostridium estertheticum]WAG43459.1 N-acetylmuramoyl-L-alanine amidase [Clostridium estertheticum]
MKTANDYVFRNSSATAMLVETPFVTNPTEEKLLVSDNYQNTLAKAIATGILKTLGITTIKY